uniref:Uncharacterized protein n=1 Tax=viral metagenome TaxID=1070528 RepID=A0A6C0ID59_9ZZZZ
MYMIPYTYFIHLRVLLHSFPRIGKAYSETDEST